jgi:mRNA interferase YafQ
LKAFIFTRKFKQDLKLAGKRHKDIPSLRGVMDLLIEGRSLPKEYKDHPLRGEFLNCRECHIEPDWLLIYKLNSSVICFIRTGSHSDLFG